jgi:hypothetical protein
MKSKIKKAVLCKLFGWVVDCPLFICEWCISCKGCLALKEVKLLCICTVKYKKSRV